MYVKEDIAFIRDKPEGTILGTLNKNAVVYFVKSTGHWSKAITYGRLTGSPSLSFGVDSIAYTIKSGTIILSSNSNDIAATLNRGTELLLIKQLSDDEAIISFWGWLQNSRLTTDITVESAPEKKDDKSPPNLPTIGEPLKFPQGIITVHDVRFTSKTNVEYDLGSMSLVVPEGGDYLILDISIENASDKILEINTYYETFLIFDEEGRKYSDKEVSAAFDGIEKDEEIDSIPPGERRRGEFVFAKPKGKEATLYYKPITEFSGRSMQYKIKLY